MYHCLKYYILIVQSQTVQLPGRTPLIFIEVEGTGGPANDTVLMYGHLDKQVSDEREEFSQIWKHPFSNQSPISRL